MSGRCPRDLGSLSVVSRDGRDRGQRLEHLAEDLLIMGKGPMEGLALYPFFLVLHLYCVCVCVCTPVCVCSGVVLGKAGLEAGTATSSRGMEGT